MGHGPSALAMRGCEVVLRLVPGLTASDHPISGFGWLPRVVGLYVLKMSVYDNIDPAHLSPFDFLMKGGLSDQQ